MTSIFRYTADELNSKRMEVESDLKKSIWHVNKRVAQFIFMLTLKNTGK